MKEIKDIFPDYHDGEFLAPKSGAKLASLFGLCQAESEGNDSFKFTAPKQPKKVPSTLGPPPQKQAPPPTAPAVLLAVAVHAFHFVNGQYVKHGKLGAAILGNHVTKEYKVLLYGSQQKQITTARIHHGFVLTVQTGNYTAFYDDQRQSWSVKFDSEEARIDFCKEVCVAKWNSQTCRDTLLTQDLVHGEGQTISMGDTVEVALSSWLLQNHAVRQLFDSNSCKDELQRVSLGSDTAMMGWEKGMLGMQKGGRRLIIVPPSMGYGSKGVPHRVPPSSTLVFAVEVHQVNFSKDADCLAAGSTHRNKSLVPGLDRINIESSVQSALSCSDQGDQAQWVKCRTLNELPKLPDADKAKLISRMAKMGQPTLPFLKVPAQPSDPAIEESRESASVCGSSAQAASSSLLPVETASSVSSSAAVQHPEAVNTRTAQEVQVCSDRAFQPYSASQLQPFTLTFPPQHTPYLTDIGSFMMTEARQHNTEIRLAVARVTDKVDYLASKVDELHKQGICSFALSSGSLETTMILHNIQRIIQENASLKKEVLEKGSRVEEQDCKIGELIEQRCMEKSSLLLEQTNDVLQSSSHHARLLKAEQEKFPVQRKESVTSNENLKEHLAEELDASSSRVCKLQQEADGLQQRVTELQAELSAVLQESQSRCALISSLESKVEELKKEVAQSQQQWREEKQKCRKMEWKMTNIEEEIQDLRAENESVTQLLSDRKRKWQQERERFLLDQEEQRSSSEQEQQHLLDQLRKARVHAGTHSRPQLELEWQERCDAVLKEQKLKLEEVISQLQKQNEKLQEELEKDRQQLEAQLAVQVKWVMNGLFRSLRAEFDLQESYSGESVLKIVLSTIKCVTMRFLKEQKSEEEEEEEEEEEYISAEESPSGRMEEHGIKSEEMDSPQSLDRTYVTAYESNSLEASEVSRDSSLASDVEKQPLNLTE
ncbi:FK506-binding protein 15 isoform X1 [Pangasianodon hypophthalmus]|uniref:FK506-binding protein 15 isoform X1 n=1 Tax=Pangasianodon hypophthalmus TaxID=310915 RepID=UPI0023079002|nr:FK506-binding protein 15 isoform X1 [Pangasianodon hypophthalmus]